MNFEPDKVVFWKKLNPKAHIPEYAHKGDSGFDLCSIEEKIVWPKETYVFKIGLACQLPEGHELQIRPRSGMSAKTAMIVKLGTVDSGYRGEIGVIMANLGEDAFRIHPGDKIAQGVIAPVTYVVHQEVTHLAESERNTNGFGSTGRRKA